MRNRGFTTVELVVAIFILGVFAAIVLSNWMKKTPGEIAQERVQQDLMVMTRPDRTAFSGDRRERCIALESAARSDPRSSLSLLYVTRVEDNEVMAVAVPHDFIPIRGDTLTVVWVEYSPIPHQLVSFPVLAND